MTRAGPGADLLRADILELAADVLEHLRDDGTLQAGGLCEPRVDGVLQIVSKQDHGQQRITYGGHVVSNDGHEVVLDVLELSTVLAIVGWSSKSLGSCANAPHALCVGAELVLIVVWYYTYMPSE